MASVPQPTVGAARQEFYRRMDKDNLAPLWEVLHDLIPNEPATACRPALWKYQQARPYLMEAGRLITAKEAIRRVLILENPGMRGESCITQSLYAGLQLILPGEIAPSHRHSRSTASAPPCAPATSSLRLPGPGTTTATRAARRWCGWTASTSASSRCSPRSSTRSIRKRCSRCRARKARL